jgi:L-aminopeptidase/D-esterase-like protein
MGTPDYSLLEGFRIGHATDEAGGTGCTVIICEKGATAGVSVRGGSPSTRETDALDPMMARKSIHAVLLAGGSAFGLDAATGVMRFLEERGIGRDVGIGVVPIVCAAVLFDLVCGDPKARPDEAMGYEACEDSLRRRGEVATGNVGAGTGATVGKALGQSNGMKGGLGVARAASGKLVVAAVVAVNSVGDVISADGSGVIAGTRGTERGSFPGSEACILARYGERKDFYSGGDNTIIGAVLTNAILSKAEANRIASLSHDGIARAIRPSHTAWDGDTIFALASNSVHADPDAVGILAARVTEEAIRNAVHDAVSAYGYPAASDWRAPA